MSLRRVRNWLGRLIQYTPSYRPTKARCLHSSIPLRTDGVYKALTEMRVNTPWIEALRKQREHGIDPTKKSDTPATPSDRDLSPKKMSNSYHRVVGVVPINQENATD